MGINEDIVTVKFCYLEKSVRIKFRCCCYDLIHLIFRLCFDTVFVIYNETLEGLQSVWLHLLASQSKEELLYTVICH